MNNNNKRKFKWQKKILNEKEEFAIENKIKELEEVTGAELVITILKASDPYPGATLRFAILSTFFLSLVSTLLYPYQLPNQLYFLLLQISFFLVSLLLGRINFFKKFCLSEVEMEREVTEKSLELFNSLELSTTTNRVGSLLVISLQERKLKLLVDKTLKEKMSKDDLQKIIKLITKEFKKRNYFNGINQAINTIKEKYIFFFPKKVSKETANQLPNSLIWEDFS